MADNTDELSEMLRDGWEVVSYSTAMLAAGALHHSILLKMEDKLVSAQITKAGDREIGRRFDTLAPMGEKPKKSFFG